MNGGAWARRDGGVRRADIRGGIRGIRCADSLGCAARASAPAGRAEVLAEDGIFWK
jgi:hypothetical protein